MVKMTLTRGASRLDSVYRSLLLTKFFTKGWGKPEHLKQIFGLRRQLADRRTAEPLMNGVGSDFTFTSEQVKKDHIILEGHFKSPAVDFLQDLLPPESEKAYFQMVLPKKWKDPKIRPMVIQYAGTGDHFFWRRRHLMALPMIREKGIGSIILECPFYGLRKPKEQFRSSLQNVSDLFLMGACLIMESWSLYKWCETQKFGPLVSHGISMGGHMASLGATVWPKPIALVPCLSWTSGSVTFTKGVLTGAINWDLLSKQYQTMEAYKEEIAELVRCEENAFKAGKEFARNMDYLTGVEAERKAKNEAPKHQRPSYSTPNKSDDVHRLSVKADVVGEGARPMPQSSSPSSYSNLMEAFHLPFLSSLTSTMSMTAKKSPSKDGNVDSSWTYMLPNIIRNDLLEDENANESVSHDVLHREAIQFMRGIMDECTHFKNYDVPVDPELIIIVAAEMDAYQPREGITALPDIWPGAKIRYIEGNGHVSSYLFKQDVFRKAIYDVLDMYLRKYPVPC